jgi:Tol biopolymer transport system component
MQAGTTTPRPRVSDIASLLLVLAGAGLLVLLLLSFILEARPRSPAATTGNSGRGRIAYFEFGVTADTLWLVDPSSPSLREKALVVPHAREFGIVPSLAPDGRSLAYAALAANDPAPSPDSPAGLWLTALARDAQPRLLAAAVDLRVPAVWRPDGSAIVYRRSDAAGFSIAMRGIGGGDERVLASSEAPIALFPVGFGSDGADFYYVALSEAGSLLVALNLDTNTEREVALLSPGITRDWSLSPDGGSLAFLAMSISADEISARAYVLHLETARLTLVTSPAVNAFGPVWDADGSLLAGTLGAHSEANLVRFADGRTTPLPGRDRGFDVPLGFARDGGAYIVRAFSGASAVAPGAATLTLIDEDGERHVIAAGDVTFAGWSAP